MTTISIVGSGGSTDYELAVSGRLTKSEALGGSIQSGDVISEDGTRATGRVAGGTDSYEFTGDLTTISIADPSAAFPVVIPSSEGSELVSENTVGPGDEQTAIDAMYESGGGVVRLRSGESYPRTEPLTVHEGVRLDFNGATLAIEADVDALHVRPGSEACHPWIDYRTDAISREHAALKFDGAWGEYGWSDGSNATVWGGRVWGVPHGGGRTTDGSLVRFDLADTGPISGVRVEGITATDFGQVWEIDAGDTVWDRCWSNTNLVSGNFGKVTQALHFHGANRMTDNRFMGFFQNGWMTERFLTFEGDVRGNWCMGTWWDLYNTTDVKENNGGAFHFGPETKRNVSISLVPYRDWPDPLPITDHGSENKVLDQHAIRGVVGDHAL